MESAREAQNPALLHEILAQDGTGSATACSSNELLALFSVWSTSTTASGVLRGSDDAIESGRAT
jgi:hypothetical protein